MAIVQVSRITQRKGLEEDLPQPLAGAELGWAVDQRRLYIGNGTLAEGAPVVGNTEILTEFSDVLAYSTVYTYLGEAAGYTVQTGATSGTPVTQSLQRRLDSYAVVTDFGAQGDGITDDTDAINRALNQLYCVQGNPQVRRSLFFPAGQYIISNTILVPSFACLYGEGRDSSIIQFRVEAWAANTAFQSGVLVSSGGLYYRSQVAVPATGILLTDTNYWQPANLPPYVMRTADSLQQTGTNIGNAGAVTPRNIAISALAFATDISSTTEAHDVCLIEKAQQVRFQSVGIQGALAQSDLTSTAEDQSGVRFSSTPSLPCQDIIFDGCSFSGATYAFNTAVPVNATEIFSTNGPSRGISVLNSYLRTLYRGVVIGGAALSSGGPIGFRIAGNTFDLINQEGVIIDGVSLNATAYNTFLDVGNQFLGVAQPASPIIAINADNNISVGDMFLRGDAAAATQPRIYLFDSTASPQTIPKSIAFTNGASLQMGTYVRDSGVQATLSDGIVDDALFTIDSTQPIQDGGFRAFRMDYTIVRQVPTTLAVRTGTLTVVARDDDDSAGAGLQFVDDFVENQHTDITLLVTQTGDNVTVSYTAGVTGTDGTIYYSLSHLA